MSFHIIRNDITKMHVDAIVNSANPEPTYAYGTDLAIYTAAGPEALLAERRRIGFIKPGDAAVTSAGKLPAKHIIHTVGPSWEDGTHDEFEILKNCYENSLRLAYTLSCRTMAFPLIATGIYGFPKDKALQIAMNTIQSFLFTHDMDIFLVVFDEKAFVLSGKIFDQIQAYVDANYVQEAHSSEYYPEEQSSNDETARALVDDALRRQVLNDLKTRATTVLSENPDNTIPASNETAGDTITNKSYSNGISLNSLNVEMLLGADQMTFQEKLFEYIDRSELKPSAIYRPIEMSRQQYSKMQSNRFYQPKKNTALLLCIVLRLSLAETEDLLSRAGFALSPSNKQDVIVKACIQCGQYDFFVIDGMMQKNHVDTLIDYDGR